MVLVGSYMVSRPIEEKHKYRLATGVPIIFMFYIQF